MEAGHPGREQRVCPASGARAVESHPMSRPRLPAPGRDGSVSVDVDIQTRRDSCRRRMSRRRPGAFLASPIDTNLQVREGRQMMSFAAFCVGQSVQVVGVSGVVDIAREAPMY
eukprot:Opistho-2@6428